MGTAGGRGEIRRLRLSLLMCSSLTTFPAYSATTVSKPNSWEKNRVSKHPFLFLNLQDDQFSRDSSPTSSEGV